MSTLWILLGPLLLTSSTEPSPSCGGTFTASRGILQTPNYPHEFPVPIKCEWVIDAQNHDANTSIIVYLTQLFVFEGLTFTEYSEYDRSFNIPGRVIHTVTEENVTATDFVWTFQKYLVVTLELETLEGNHLRVLDHFLDVFGFNVTYEVTSKGLRTGNCMMAYCGFTGVCQDYYTKFGCDCFPGYSGRTCSEGPQSYCVRKGVPVCKNGATCVHVGTPAVSCHCREGFEGDVCERALKTGKQGCDTCVVTCPFDGNLEHACRCPKGYNASSKDRIAFSGTLRLSNLPKLNNEALQAFIENQIRSNLRGNFTKADNLLVHKLKAGKGDAEVVLHFYGVRREEKKIKSILNKWAHRGYIGNVTIPSREITFHNSLTLQNVSVKPDGLIREGGDLIVSCLARGPSTMSFRWFKDGVFVNVTRAESRWTQVHSDASDQFGALLGIDRATPLDAGVFTCQVEDHGIQQCLSVEVGVKKPPVVKLEPMSLTVTKGEGFKITCISLDEDSGRKYVYSWSKNGKLLPVRTELEKYLILYPRGSILQVSGIDKSTSYSCLVQGEDVRTEVGIRVNVIDRNAVRTCAGESHLNILWPETSPGTEDVEGCPGGYAGVARRLCTLRDAANPTWQLPDFSECTHAALAAVTLKFQRLRLGYQETSSRETLASYRKHLNGGVRLLPGEGARILTFVRDVISFINSTTTDMEEPNNTTALIFGIIDAVLRQRDSLVNQSQVILLQQVVKEASVLWGSTLINPQSILHQSFATIDVNMAPTDKSIGIPFPETSYPNWFSYKLNLRLGVSNTLKLGNYSSPLVNVVYRNLSSFLPARSIFRLRDGTEIEYEIISQIAFVWLPDTHTPNLLMEFAHPRRNPALSSWKPLCATADFAAAHEYAWNPTGCRTRIASGEATRCSCSVFGTFAVLLTNAPQAASREPEAAGEVVVLVGCACGLALAAVTAGVLLVYWAIRRSCLVFLKLQCAVSVAGAMGVFVVAVASERGAALYVYTVPLLEIFLLVSLASQLSKLLVVYTEVVQLPRPSGIKQTVIGIITGVPVITVFGNHLAHRTTDSRFVSWWLVHGSLSFSIFVTCASVISFLFLFLYATVMRKLRGFANLHSKCSKALQKRVGLLRRSACVFVSLVVVMVSSILYVNVGEKSAIWQYEFCVSSAFTGFTLILLYILKSETSMRQHFVKGLKLNKDDNYFSSDLSFFTKQEPDVESECIPQQKRHHVLANGNRPPQETYRLSEPFLQEGVSTLAFHLTETTSFAEKRPDDIESYSSSPKHFGYGGPESAHPDVIARKVCAELDLVASSLRRANRSCGEAQKVLPRITVTPDDAIAKLLEDPAVKCLGEDAEEGGSLDGMLDKISHDLDYLLNRSGEEVAGSFPRRLSKPSMLEGIEEENEEDEKGVEGTSDILRTVC